MKKVQLNNLQDVTRRVARVAEALGNKEISLEEARTNSTVCKTIIAAVRMQADYNKQTGKATKLIEFGETDI
jgi:hypothetical protein